MISATPSKALRTSEWPVARQSLTPLGTGIIGRPAHRGRDESADTSASVTDYAAQLDGRIVAFARVQSIVTNDPAAGLNLETLITDILISVSAQESNRVSSIRGPPVLLQARAAETIGLAIHELATNAVKYGALSTEQGQIKVEWNIDEAGYRRRLVLHWVESGVNLSGEPPVRKGFGMELIQRTLAYELGGKARLEFGKEGLRCTFMLPVDERLMH